MFNSLLRKWFDSTAIVKGTFNSHQSLSGHDLQYAKDAYPSNHTYEISDGKLFPLKQLKQRYKKIESLLPNPLTSLLDTAASKGYFVFNAASKPTCKRSLGIDVNEPDIQFCRRVKEYLGSHTAQFEVMRLHELAEQVETHGGPFQTVILLNMYQYLFFGSEYYPQRYLDHDAIFAHLRKVCSSRIIFNNRINMADVQINKTMMEGIDYAKHYTQDKVRAAAEKYFTVTEHGMIGRYPLWVMDVK